LLGVKPRCYHAPQSPAPKPMTKLLDRTRTRTPRAGGVRARRSGHSPAPHW